MSSNEYRLSSLWRRWHRCIYCEISILDACWFTGWRHAAVNARRRLCTVLACCVGGEAGERGKPPACPRRVRAGASEPGVGAGAAFHRRPGLLPGRGQSAGEVRDAACPSGRGSAGDRGCGGARLFAGGVLSGVGGVRAAGNVGVAGRAARPPWSGEAISGGRGVHPLPNGGLGSPDRRAGGRPVRVAAAPADRRAGPRPVSARSFWPPAEAAQFDYETLRDHLLEQGTLPGGLAAARFARRGLAGLIAWPAAEPLFIPEITGADRPRWSPHVDTREDVLAVCYQFLLDAATTRAAGSGRAGALPGGWRCMRACRP